MDVEKYYSTKIEDLPTDLAEVEKDLSNWLFIRQLAFIYHFNYK